MITQVHLQNFRNYFEKTYNFNYPLVAITGANGVGKTNLLEGISLFAPGKGLRKSSFQTMQNNNSSLGWMVGITIDSLLHLGTAYSSGEKRIIKVNGEIASNRNILSEYLRLFWLTPEHDRLFVDSPSIQRKFIDRMVYAQDPKHLKRLKNYEHCLKERMHILQNRGDYEWLVILEQRLAEEAFNIVQARQQILENITKFQLDCLPKFQSTMEGESEIAYNNGQDFAQFFYKYRSQDGASGTTSFGPNRSRLKIIFNAKKQEALFCSTGEQKILLLSLVLAFISYQVSCIPALSVILLDDVVSHLDINYRILLFQQLIDLTHQNTLGKMQVWMSGTDIESFSPLQGKAEIRAISS